MAIFNSKILECVPNFSEGRDEEKIRAIASAVESVKGVVLLHVDISPAANRTVMTFAGEPEAVTEAAYRAIEKAAQLIDMTGQEGVHPRIGATDVCPLIPLHNMEMEEAVMHANKLAERVATSLKIPVYLYEYSAKEEFRRALPSIRKGQYEGFSEKMKEERWQPDFGPGHFNSKTGATVIGARDILVAFNIALDTDDVQIASKIAAMMRESGYYKNEGGNRLFVKGMLPKLRAIGWYMKDYQTAQVSFNLLDYKHTSPLKVWETCEAIAKQMNVKLIGSEVIGLIPERCLLEAGKFAQMKEGTISQVDDQLLIYKAIEFMGLNKLKPFNPQEKVLEYALENKKFNI
jgi:glutamate formiminotransferase/formiminotetrahydrofolate cyclodeaminase